jgi:hypothetical protein
MTDRQADVRVVRKYSQSATDREQHKHPDYGKILA